MKEAFLLSKLEDTYLKAGELVYFASKDTVKKLALSWLVAMTMTAERVAPKAKNLNRRWQILVVLLAMDSTKQNLVHNDSWDQGKVNRWNMLISKMLR